MPNWYLGPNGVIMVLNKITIPSSDVYIMQLSSFTSAFAALPLHKARGS